MKDALKKSDQRDEYLFRTDLGINYRICAKNRVKEDAEDPPTFKRSLLGVSTLSIMLFRIVDGKETSIKIATLNLKR